MDSLFTPEERIFWQDQYRSARLEQPSDNVVGRYNPEADERGRAVSRARSVSVMQRLRERPELIAGWLLVLFGARGTYPKQFSGYLDSLGYPLPTFDDPDLLPEEATAADTEPTRRLVHTYLRALQHVPLTWGDSALTRFLRGVGPQGEEPWKSRIGSGLLSSKNGWLQQEAANLVARAASYPVGEFFRPDTSPEPWGEEANEIAEAGGNPFAVVRKERYTAGIEAVLAILEARGIGPEPVIPEPVPVKVKVWKQGDRITAQNIKLLPPGSHFQSHWSVHRYHRKKPGYTVEHQVFEAVFEKRVGRGKYQVRPVMKGMSFAPRVASPAYLNRAEYIGPWAGDDLLEVEAVWKPTSTSVQG